MARKLYATSLRQSFRAFGDHQFQQLRFERDKPNVANVRTKTVLGVHFATYDMRAIAPDVSLNILKFYTLRIAHLRSDETFSGSFCESAVNVLLVQSDATTMPKRPTTAPSRLTVRRGFIAMVGS